MSNSGITENKYFGLFQSISYISPKSKVTRTDLQTLICMLVASPMETPRLMVMGIYLFKNL